MSETTYKGRTHADWLMFQGKGGKLGCPSEAEICEALLWYDAEDKRARFEAEERRFQTQLNEAKRHGWWTRLIAGVAATLSAGSLVVAIVALNKQPLPSPQAPPTLSPVPVLPLPQTTNSVPASKSPAAQTIQSNAEPYLDMRPADDSHFSADEQRMVAAARAYLEKSRGKPLDARYRVEHTRDGCQVFAMFVAGYENGRPLFYPGGHGSVVLSAEGTFIRYMPGM
jgi:hypothetical protein